MVLKQKIEENLGKAFKERNELSVSVLRLIKSAIKNAEIEKKEDLADDEILNIIEKQAKQRRESMELYKTAGREDLRGKEELELKILEEYLPEKLTEDEIRDKVLETIKSLQESDKNNFGKVMGASIGELKGKADPSLVNKVVREIIEG